MLAAKTLPIPKIQKPSWLSISTISASSGFNSQILCAASRPRLASSSVLAVRSGGNWFVVGAEGHRQVQRGQGRLRPPAQPRPAPVTRLFADAYEQSGRGPVPGADQLQQA